jgi:hypothetical protein
VQYFKVKWPWIAVILVFIVVHNDFWWWENNRMVLGLPVGFVFHIFYCIACFMLFSLIIRYNPVKENIQSSGTEDQP